MIQSRAFRSYSLFLSTIVISLAFRPDSFSNAFLLPGVDWAAESHSQNVMEFRREPTRLFLERSANTKNTNSTNDYLLPSTRKTSTRLDYSLTDIAIYGMQSQPPKVYCDLDGVLVDFEHAIVDLLNAPSSQLVKGTMWKTVARTKSFFENLPWTKDGKKLWKTISHLKPDILTGVPYPKTSRVEKYKWCKRELGLKKLNHVDMAAGYCDHEPVNGNSLQDDVTNIITCWSNNKHHECTYGSVLIDDRESARENWEKAGGIFVHHVDTETTIQKLKDLGILPIEDHVTEGL